MTASNKEVIAGGPPPAPLREGGAIADLSAEGGELGQRVPVFALRPVGNRGARWRLARVSFVLVALLPTLLAAVYYFLLAANQYVVEFRFAVRSVEPLRSDAPALIRSSVQTAQLGLDSNILVQYLRSRAIVEELGQRFKLEKIFSPKEADWLSRLHPPVPIERLVRYWDGQVDAFFDTTDGTVTVKLRAFRPEDALSLARAALGSCERLVNQLSHDARRAALEQSRREVEHAERRLEVVLMRLREFRDREAVINPRQAADRTLSLAAAIRKEILGEEAQLASLKSYISESAPSVRMLRTRIAALKSEERALEAGLTAAEKKAAPAPGSDAPQGARLSQLMGNYAQIESERRFAETAYRHALAALDRERAEADRRQFYLATFVPPSLPEEALYPRRLRAILTVFVIAFALWAIGGLAVQSIRDHF